MTPKEFVIWLQGFVDASHNYNLTPASWDALKEKLKTVTIDENQLRNNSLQ